MAYTDKYYKKWRLDDDFMKRAILYTFESVHDGTADFSKVFKMTKDEHVREYVDDEDYAFWLEQKALHAND